MAEAEQGQGGQQNTQTAPQTDNQTGAQGGTLLGGNAPQVQKQGGQNVQNGQDSQNTAPQAAQGQQQAQQNAVPEKYEYDVPDTWDDAYKTKVESIARENKLNNAQMKKFAEMAQNEHQAYLEERQKNMQAWENELKQDPDFAGDNFNQSVQYALAGLNHIDEKGDLKKVLEESGYGSHPAVVRAMYKIGKMLDNDKIVGNGANVSTLPTWKRMYNEEN